MTGSLGKIGKPSLLTRLGHIIVIQVVFVFAAVALILFYPNEPDAIKYDFAQAGMDFEQASGEVAQILDVSDSDAQYLPIDKQISDSLHKLLVSRSDISAAAIYAENPGGVPECMYSYQREDESGETTDAIDLLQFGAGKNLLSALLSEENKLNSSRQLSPRHVIHYHRMLVPGREPVVLVSASEHNLVVSSRAQLQYGLLLLFLVSALVSLLTVYLIMQRFQEPLSLLKQGLEKTAAGELYYTIEADGDEQVQAIVESFNKMSRTLWEDQKRLKAFNKSLQDAYLSQAESQAFLVTLIENSPCSIIAVDNSGEIMIFNQKAAQTFGYDSTAALKMKIDQLIVTPGHSGSINPCEDAQVECEVICRRHDGEQFPAFLIASQVSDRSDQTIAHLICLLDISESKSFQEMMVRVDRYYTRGEMAGDIAHEINNYLAVLGGNVELMPLFMKRGDQEKIDKKLELMKNTVDKIAKFTDGLMDVNTDEIHFDRSDVNQVIQNLLAFLKPQNRFDDVEFDVQLSTELPLADLDAGQIQQTLVNLLNNAADAVCDCEQKEVRIVSELVQNDGVDAVRISIYDNGPGVPEDKQELLFVKRFTTKRKGHGYGLVTCRRIMDSHNGLISYTADQQTCFSFEFPLHHESVESSEEQSQETAQLQF